MSNEFNDEGFADCPPDPHEGCGGPGWHALSLEDRALDVVDGEGPWWAKAAREIVGEPVFEIAECGHVECDSAFVEDALEIMGGLEQYIHESRDLLQGFVEGKHEKTQVVAAVLWELCTRAGTLECYLSRVQVAFPDGK
jgi:hypothetical protein